MSLVAPGAAARTAVWACVIEQGAADVHEVPDPLGDA
jgi:hypothetical protein